MDTVAAVSQSCGRTPPTASRAADDALWLQAGVQRAELLRVGDRVVALDPPVPAARSDQVDRLDGSTSSGQLNSAPWVALDSAPANVAPGDPLMACSDSRGDWCAGQFAEFGDRDPCFHMKEVAAAAARRVERSARSCNVVGEDVRQVLLEAETEERVFDQSTPARVLWVRRSPREEEERLSAGPAARGDRSAPVVPGDSDVRGPRGPFDLDGSRRRHRRATRRSRCRTSHELGRVEQSWTSNMTSEPGTSVFSRTSPAGSWIRGLTDMAAR